MKLFAVLHVFWLFPLVCYTSESAMYSPPIKFHEIPEQREDFAIWQIDFHADGRLLCASEMGICEFDGLRWEVHQGCKRLRSLTVDEQNRVFTGGIGNLGYWEMADNDYHYHSLNEKTDGSFYEIWEVVINNKLVYYQSFENIFVYDIHSDEMRPIKAPYQFVNLFCVNGRIFVLDLQEGLMEIVNYRPIKKTFPISQPCKIEQLIYAPADNTILVATHHSIYKVDEKSNRASMLNVNFNADVHIQTLTPIDENTLAIGTITHGVYIINHQGDILQHLDKRSGMEKLSTHTQNIDHFGHLWLGNFKGVTQINLTSPLLYNSDVNTQDFRINDILTIDNSTYLATDKGVYKSRNGGAYKLIPQLSGLTMFIDSIKGEIIVGMHKGTWVIEKNDEVRELSKEIGAWFFTRVQERGNIMVGGNYRGIVIYVFENGRWKELKKLSDFNVSSRFIYADKRDILWVSHPSEGYYKLNVDFEKGIINKIENYKASNCPLTPPYFLSSYRNKPLFFSSHRYYGFNSLENSFVANEELNRQLGDKLEVYHLSEINNKLWIADKCGYWVYDEELKRLPHFDFPILSDFANINAFNNEHIAFGLLRSFVLYSSKKDSLLQHKAAPQFKQAYFVSSKGKIRRTGKQAKVSHKYSTLVLDYYMPDIPIGAYPDFEYLLEGSSAVWEIMNRNMSTIFNSLPSGKYTFKIRSLETKEELGMYVFRIASPWYLSWWGISLLILSITSITLIISGNAARLRELKKINYINVEEKKRAEQQKEYEHQLHLNEKKIHKIEEERLLDEVSQQRNELMSSVLANTKKNELILEIKEKIENITPGNATNQNILNRLMRRINFEINNKEEWVTFELRFKSANKLFYEHISQKHPNLTPNEFRLCVYIKLKISNKEIASLMNISVKSVEMARYRLRKKLELDKSISINEYITTLGTEVDSAKTKT